ncbi:MAG TPA: amino acid permease [Gemmataceae bacterium]|jgi:amino acid transporter|nr:amino acid permease [Gemmataceae bacterium]
MNTPGQLPRVLGYFTATAIVVGTVIGSGVFKKASAVAQKVPESGLALSAWVVVGVLTLIGALILAEVAVIVGKAGGNYAILRDSYGRMAGFLFGWVEFWIIRSASIAALATIFADSVHDILKHYHPDGPDVRVLSPVQLAAMTATVIAVLAAVNARGTRLGGGLQLAITLVKVSSLVLIAILPYVMIGLTSAPEKLPDSARLHPIWPTDGIPWVAYGGALVGVFWAYNGWMNIAPMAEEIKNPQRNLPLSLLTGVGLLILMYVSANLAYLLIIPANEIVDLQGRTVAGEFSFRILGKVGLLFASAAIMISVFGALNGNLLVGPRLLFAMGQDGLAPRGLSRLHPRYLTPARAIIVLAGWSILMVTAVAFLTTNRLKTFDVGSHTIDMNLPDGKDPFDVITDFAMFGSLSFETLAVASIFVLRRRFPVATVKLAYRCPLFPWLPIVFVLCQGAVLVNMFRTQETEAKTGLVFILVGAVVYLLFGRRRAS